VATHDYVIANGTGAAVRSDINGALAAIVSQNSNASAPATTYAYMSWADTTAGVMKMRNGANSAWISLYQLDGEWTSIAFENGTAAAPSIYFKDSGTDTGIYSPGADQVGISTGGIGRITIDGSGNVNIDSNTLYVDAATNRVGIGTNSPQAVCHVSLGNILLSNAYYLASRNAADNASLSLIGRDTSNNVIIDPDGYGIRIGGTTLVTTSAGRVGIGTTGPGTLLDLSTTTSAKLNLTYPGFGIATLASDSTGSLLLQADEANTQASSIIQFKIDGGEKARLDSSGRLLVGTSTSEASITSAFQIVGSGFAGTQLIYRPDNNTFGSTLYFMKSRGSTISSKTIIQSGDYIGRIGFYGADGSADVQAAEIAAYVDGTPGTNDMPGRLVFSTTPDGSASPTPRMTITNGGNILTNTTSTYSASVCTTDFNSASQFGLTLRDTGSATDAVMMYFYKSGNVRGNITTTATATAFNTSSDYRLKRDVVPIENASSRVQQLRPVNFAWEETGSRCDGFLAHEAQAVVPECVTGEKDAEDADGNPVYQGIDQSKLVPLLTAALQEAIAKIEALETRLSALEAA